MKTLTALSALKRDPNSTAATLAEVASDMLGTTSDQQLAQARFTAAVAANPLLVAQLFDQDIIRATAAKWFAGYARTRPPQGVGAAKGALPQGRGHCAAPELIDAEGHSAAAHMGQVQVADCIDPISARGLLEIAQAGRNADASRAEPHDDGGGHSKGAAKAIEELPTAVVTPKPGGGGHHRGADKATHTMPPSARPQSRADLAGQRRAALSIAETLFDRFKMRDGTPIGDIRWSQIDHYRAKDLHSAAVLERIKRHAQPPPGSDPIVRLMVSLKALESFVEVRNAV